MKRPPFKINGRRATLRYTDGRGKRIVTSGRISFLVNRRWLLSVIAGTGSEFEISLTRGVWHRLEATPEEARTALLANDKLGSNRRLVARSESIRAARERS